MTSLFDTIMAERSGAIFSECRKYRYLLWRRWGDGKSFAHLCGLNPSTADAEMDDPTIRREIGFAKSWGMDGLLKTNAYAFRATDPKDMLRAEDPEGSECTNWILRAHSLSAFPWSVACWGVNCSTARQADLRSRIEWRCFGLTKDGFPKHPLYLKATTPLVSICP